MYDNKASHINWREQDLYGAKRLGVFLPNLRLGTDSIQAAWDTMGHKRYELTNHLGNVMATITDRRLQAVTHDSVVTAFDAEVVNAQDYNSFGSIMEGRQLSTADSALYRYGFNGKENDNDVGKGTGGEQDYGARIYDPRIGRFLSIDPLQHQYPELTPYQFSSNSPVQASDLDGLEADFSKGKIDLLSYNKDDDDETKVNVFTVNTVLNIYNSAVDMVEMATNFNPVTNIIYKGKGYDKLLNTSKTTVAGAYDWTVNTSWGQKGEDLKNAATNPHTYEAVAALAITYKLGKLSGPLLEPDVVSMVKTAPDEAFFWSGRTEGVGGESRALEIAKSKGGTTLEELMRSRGINLPEWDANNPKVVKAWETISEEYASHASGKVRAVVGKDLRAGNIWQKELERLKANKKVTEIITIDPKTSQETTIFKR